MTIPTREAFERGTDTVRRTPTGDVAPTGRAVSVDYVQVLHFRDGLHVAFNLLFDRLLTLEQLELLPALAVTARQRMDGS